MKGLDICYLCTTIGNLSGIPIRIFEGNNQIFYYSTAWLPKDPMTVYQTEIWKIHTSIGYFATNHFHYYGIVNSGSLKIVVGPTRQLEDSDQELRELAFRADIPVGEIPAFVEGMRAIVQMPLESVMQMLCTVNFVLNGEKKTLADIAIFDSQQMDLTKQLQQQQIRQKDQKEQSAAGPHNTFDTEQALLRLIRKGDTAALKEWIARAPAVRGGVLAPDQLRQRKNTFIVTATLASRAAIRGGMAVEDAFTLSDSYIQKCELLQTPEQITNLNYHMILDYTQRVERLHLGKTPSQLTVDVANFVQHHLSEAIPPQAIADKLFLSRSSLSRRFKAETGQTLTDFIMGEKVEEAKRLLCYSEKPLNAIGAYLGFSSQSHFSRVFKQITGKTPSEYRNI